MAGMSLQRLPLLHLARPGSSPTGRRAATRSLCRLASVLLLAFACAPAFAQPAARLIEAAGVVELQRENEPARRVAAGEPLLAGDRLRTGPASRAAVQLTDRSIVRLDQVTALQILPPRSPSALRRFRLELGRLFFFHRERPADIEFETPLVTGAIRGTEFVLAVPDAGTTSLDLLDGAVELDDGASRLVVTGRERVTLRAGQLPVRQPLPVAAAVQWALHYPMVVDAGELPLTPEAAGAWSASLAAYRAGDALEALALAPAVTASESAVARTLRAALLLAVGQAEAAAGLVRGVETAPARAVRELLAVAAGTPADGGFAPASASEWLAHSYRLQAAADLRGARDAAREAVRLAPAFGAAVLRLGELEFALERLDDAQALIARGRALAPRHPLGPALAGWTTLADQRPAAALGHFEETLALDASLGDAWLGRGLALEALRRHDEALAAFQAAAATEPLRSPARSYLARAWAAGHDAGRARKELGRAIELDPNDPTPWLVSGLLRREQREVNGAVRDLERSLDLNDRRGVFRSRLGLDRDRALRSATLAPAYDDAGLPEAAEALASRAVTEDYANFAAHLFLAQSLALQGDPLRYDLGLETPRQNELLLANLLAPAGSGNLSSLFAQQDSLRLFRPPELGFSSLTTYRDSGHWAQSASVFGSLVNFDYAVDGQFIELDRDRPNSDFERLEFSVAARQRVTPDDHLYFQAAWGRTEAGDVARLWDPADANPGLRVENELAPLLVAGWQHRWSPANVTLALATYAEDDLELADPQRGLPFLRQRDGVITDIETGRAVYDLDLHSRYRLGGAEVQHIWQAEEFGLIAGARYQRGELEHDATLAGPLPPPLADGSVTGDLERAGGYALGQWRPRDWLRLDAGLGYDSVHYPRNPDLPPFDGAEDTRDAFTPRAGLTLAPRAGPVIQAAYGRSLGGLFFDPGLRLEPARLAGFNQAFRSLVPESVAGLVPAALFDTAGLRADHAFRAGTYAGVQLEWRRSDGTRDAGAVSNSLPLPLPDTPATLTEDLDFEERVLGAYVQQLLGRHWSLGARYRVARAELETRLPGVPRDAAGLDTLEQDVAATLQQVTLSARWRHHRGWFAQWQSAWWHQDNDGYGADRPADDDFWQHDVLAGYRWPRRVVEVQAGVLNLFDQDYRLNPLNAAPEPPRERTFFLSLRLNF